MEKSLRMRYMTSLSIQVNLPYSLLVSYMVMLALLVPWRNQRFLSTWCKYIKAYSPGARRSIFPLMRRLSIIKAGKQHTVKTSRIVLISRPNSTHSLVKVLVPVVFIFELTNAVLT